VLINGLARRLYGSGSASVDPRRSRVQALSAVPLAGGKQGNGATGVPSPSPSPALPNSAARRMHVSLLPPPPIY